MPHLYIMHATVAICWVCCVCMTTQDVFDRVPQLRHASKFGAGLQDNEVVPAEEWVELANGCLCCSVKNDFVAALEGLMLKRDKFDYILIETTGQPDSEWVTEYCHPEWT